LTPVEIKEQDSQSKAWMRLRLEIIIFNFEKLGWCRRSCKVWGLKLQDNKDHMPCSCITKKLAVAVK